MPSDLLPAKTLKARVAPISERLATPFGLMLFDGVLLFAFLSLVFLLGAFPLKDTDFWWHLKAGDMIRASGSIPTVDTFTFTVEGEPWIDLHWVYQVAISWLYERGGVPAVNLAKCGVTTLALLLLVTARRKEWPIWAILLAWLPALLVLSGRMYVRPETLTLLYLACYLAVLCRIDRYPGTAYALPFVQVLWVNTQGLFVFGPILFGFALLDALMRPGSLSKARTKWWKTVTGAGLLVGLACLFNPYGLSGALYPLQLAGTMSNPIFTNSIAELMPIPVFLEREGMVSLPFRLQLATMALGALSFLIPIVWVVSNRFKGRTEETLPAPKPTKTRKESKKSKRTHEKKQNAVEPFWRLSVFRVLLFVAFSLLSWRATRNSHQFAAVVGTLTSWNFGELAYAMRRKRLEASTEAESVASSVVPRLGSLAAILAVLVWVASGSYYAAAKEERTIGLGEEPLWYPKEAIRFAGIAGMPDRFVGFHVGHPSLYEYAYAPDRKVFVDARLEVMGPELYERFLNLQSRIRKDDPSWTRELDDLERPSVLIDHGNAELAASILHHPDWRCVWFDPIAALFVHKSYHEIADRYTVDFGKRHFNPVSSEEPSGTDAVFAYAKGIRSVASHLAKQGPDKVHSLVLLGYDQTRRLTEADPSNVEAWKLAAQLEMVRELPWTVPIARFRSPFDPVFDLSIVRQTYLSKRALELAPDDFMTLGLLLSAYQSRRMNEAASPLLERLVQLTPINPIQRKLIDDALGETPSLLSALGPLLPPPDYQNLKELAEIVDGLLAHGRVETAALYLEKASEPDSRTWEEADRIGSLWLHLGDPRRARTIWQGVEASSKPGLKAARVAATFLIEGNEAEARASYQAAVEADPKLFEAQYGRAILEQDAGQAAEALEAARKAAAAASTDAARTAAQSLVVYLTPYAHSGIATAGDE